MLKRIPDADYLYFGDTARLPYGSKSAATVAHYAVGAVRYLQEQGAELLVIACNTATALALDEIKAAAGVEVIGVVEPGAEAAAAASRKRKVVVIGTEATISSHAYRRALEARESRGAREGLSSVCAAGRRGMGGTSGDRAGGEDLFVGSVFGRCGRWRRTCWCSAARTIR